MRSFLDMFVNEDANTVNHKTAPNFLIKGKNKSLKKVTVSSPMPSGDTKTFLRKVTVSSPMPSGDIKTFLKKVTVSSPRPSGDTKTFLKKVTVSSPRPSGDIKTFLEKVTVSSPRPSGDIRTFLKEQRIREKKFLQKKNALYPITILNQTYLSSTKIIYYLFLSIILLV